MAKINYYKYLRYLIKRKLYYAITRSYPVWYFWVNREGRRLFKNNKPDLDEAQKKIVADLKTRGVAVAGAEELGVGSLVFELKKMAQELRSGSNLEKGEDKKFLTYLLGRTPELAVDGVQTRFAVHPKILDIVNSYLGVWSKLHELDLNITRVVSFEEARTGSQKWHRDPEDKKICKVFLYLTDVDETAGPFTYVLGSQYGGRWREIFPQSPPAGSYPPEGKVEKIVSKEDIKAFSGKASTVIFCDTSGLHRGGYATGRERIMLTAGFVTKGCVQPHKFTYPADYEAKRAKLSGSQKYSL